MADISALQDALSGVVPDTGFMLDNRTILEHLQYLEQYARHIPYGPEASPTGKHTWADYLFMNGNTPEILAALYHEPSTADGFLPPHQAMLLALFRMLETPRALMNYFPDAHRDLYYRQQLQLEEREALPQQVAIAIQLEDAVPEMMLPAGTLLSAGQSDQGVPIEFATDDDLFANQCIWGEMRWCVPPKGNGLPGISAIVYNEEHAWQDEGKRLFTTTEQDTPIVTGRMLTAEDFVTKLTPDADQIFTLTFENTLSPEGLQVEISGGEEWLELVYKETISDPPNTLSYTLRAPRGEIAPPSGRAEAEFSVPVLRLSRKDGTEVPEVSGVSIDDVPVEGHIEQFIITPFGHAGEAQSVSTPQLFLGIKELAVGQTLTLFWNLKSYRPLNLTWQYLTVDNQWQELNSRLVDETQGMFHSGLWSVILPDDASDVAPSMPPGQRWFRAVFNDVTAGDTGSEMVPQWPWLTGLITNGMTATLTNVTLLDNQVLEEPLSADTIHQPVSIIIGVSGVQQPWESWAGRPSEPREAFYTRVAERISHRGRALTWPDMVQILKTTFPYIFDVLTPSGETLTTVPALGTQLMTVIPLIAEQDNDDPLRPLFNSVRLEEMSEFLQQRASLWQSIKVKNPRYRDVLLNYKVSFKDGVNTAWAERELREALTAQYMPWSTDAAASVVLANRIDYYEVMASLQEKSYVDYIASLTLDHDEKSVQGEDDEVLILCWPEEV
ncbi:hypothetical protein ACR9GP_22710 [Enterobacter ludwigii]